MVLPTIHKAAYNQEIIGSYGEFGTGGGTHIYYVQSSLNPSQLDRISLIRDIPGSEKWSVRDLFQRDVDVERVTSSLLPYLQSRDRVKFFSPIVLTVIPYEGDRLVVDLPKLDKVKFQAADTSWHGFELENKYRIGNHENASIGLVQWNDQVVRVVAIDGQHRLSALKRMKDSPESMPQELREEFKHWNIPVVLFAVRALSDAAQHKRILDVIRSVFVYINTEAKAPSAARQILLSDEDIYKVSTQEALDYVHSNDLLSEEQRKNARPPLLCFDWRGAQDNLKDVAAPSALISIEELMEWMVHYILGETPVEIRTALGVTPADADLNEALNKEKLNAKQAEKSRKLFSERVLPGMMHVLEAFEPIKKYVLALRVMEHAYRAEGDIAKKAFDLLRFGDAEIGKNERQKVLALNAEISNKLKLELNAIPELFRKDIGLRGVFSAYALLKPYFDRAKKKTVSWADYAEWFVKHLNAAFQQQWFVEQDGPKSRLLRHVVKDHNQSVVNYRLSDVKEAFGPYIAVAVSALANKSADKVDFWGENGVWERLGDETLNATIHKGYKKEARYKISERMADKDKRTKEFHDAVKKEAAKMLDKHMEQLKEAVEQVAGKAQ